MTTSIERRCDDFRMYMHGVLLPAFEELEPCVRSKTLRLHQVFSANLFLAHAVDYLHAIRKEDGIRGGRTELVRAFDRILKVGGDRLGNRKFELIDAVNNALKHIRLESQRYLELEGRYGPIAFSCLVQDEGKVLCMLEGYRFDYARVVLLPAFEALGSVSLETSANILAFARGEISPPMEILEDVYRGDPSDAIDRMIDHCNPLCGECGEDEEDCSCATYVFEGQAARFEPMFNPSFDFDQVMSEISGAYRRS